MITCIMQSDAQALLKLMHVVAMVSLYVCKIVDLFSRLSHKVTQMVMTRQLYTLTLQSPIFINPQVLTSALAVLVRYSFEPLAL